MNRKYIRILTSILLLLFCITSSVFAQQDKIKVSGTVTDEKNEAIIGANIFVKDQPGLGVATDVDGKYSLQVKKNATLVFTYVGYDKQEVDVNGQTTIDVKMKPSENSVLNEVVVTATGPQKKVSVSGAITTVDVNTLKMPTSNITNALAGNVAGIISMQISGEPGANQSEFWIRGISTFGANTGALVLVDGFERPFNEINIEDIESFSVLKDASATAIYGSRGANGVVLITTKRGTTGKISINGKVEYGYNTRTRTPDFVDGLTYAKLINEARTTRNLEPLYNNVEMKIIQNNLDPDLYPNVNWKDVLLKNGSNTYRAAVNVSGGGSTTRYYISGSYTNEGGMYKTDDMLKSYNTNSNMERYNYRMNADMDITPTTLLSAGVSGFLEKQNHAGLSQSYIVYTNVIDYQNYILRQVNGDGINIWKSIMGYSPLATPLQYSNGLTPAYGTAEFTNPWVLSTQTGYNEAWENKMETNVSLDQKLDFITEGLKFTGRIAFDNDNKNNINHIKWPEQYNTQRRRDVNGALVFLRVSTENPMSQESNSYGRRDFSLEGELLYNKVIAKDHTFNLFLKYAQREERETSNVGTNILRGIPYRDQSYSGRASYNFKNRYFVEFNGGYTGSEVFKFGHQFGFFPAISGAWNISEEPFVKNITSIFDLLKIRYSYGQVGNNKIMQGDTEVRFPYIGSIGYMNGYNYGDINMPNVNGFGSQSIANDPRYYGMTVTTLAADYLTWEVATKQDLGLDFNLWNNKFSGVIDIFQETRSDIYMQRTHLSTMTGLSYLSNINGENHDPWANVGKMQNKGFDGQFNYTQKFGEVELTMRGNITYTHNKVLEYDEEANALPYKMTQGYQWQQAKGLIAVGLFNDYNDIRNSPTQAFRNPDNSICNPMPGDIKYKDINGDGVIDDNDIVAIGSTRIPNLIYGVGVSGTWRGFDLNVHFQGAGKSSYFINGPAVYPFSQIVQDNTIPKTLPWGNVLSDIENNYWSTNNTPEQNANAKYPRLSYGANANNYQASTWWLRNGAYLRFKTLELGYTIPKKTINKLHINNLRVYFVGTNLLLWDTLKLWDPELGSGNGMDYPPTKGFTGGFTITL